MMLSDVGMLFSGWSKFPTDKTYGSTILGRFHTIFYSLALPLALLGLAGWLPNASQLVAAWGIFWLGIFRYWLRDTQLDDSVLDRAAADNFLFTVPIAMLMAYFATALCFLELLGGAPALPFLVGYSLFAGGAMSLTVLRRSLHNRRKRLRAASHINHAG